MIIKDFQNSESKMEVTKENEKSILLFDDQSADVCFLCGESKEPVYGHRRILADASDVFEGLFFGALKVTKYEFQEPDVTAEGFRNMVRYIYTKMIDFDLAEMVETFVCVDKYLLMNDFDRDFGEYLKGRLDKTNCVPLFNQLVALENAPLTLGHCVKYIKTNRDLCNYLQIYDRLVRSDSPVLDELLRELLESVEEFLIMHSEDTFGSEQFLQLNLSTLLRLLKKDRLRKAEFDLVGACCRWLKEPFGKDLTHQNEQALFRRSTYRRIVKQFIRFSDLTLEEANSKEVRSLLTASELQSLLQHLSSERQQPFILECQTPRKRAHKMFSALVEYESTKNKASSFGSIYLHMAMKSSHDVSIKRIYTTLPAQAEEVDLEVHLVDLNDLDFHHPSFRPELYDLRLVDNKWILEFSNFRFRSDLHHYLVFSFKKPSITVYNDCKFEVGDISFTVYEEHDVCIERIDFEVEE